MTPPFDRRDPFVDAVQSVVVEDREVLDIIRDGKVVAVVIPAADYALLTDPFAESGSAG